MTSGGARRPRPSLSAIALFAALLPALAVSIWPSIALALAAGAAATEPAPSSELLESGRTVLLRSLLWAGCGAGAGVLLAWPASRAFRHGPAGFGNRGCAALVLLGVMLPPWLSSAALWMSTGPGTSVGDFIERADAMTALRTVILCIALTAWSAGFAFLVLVVAGPPRISTDGRLLAIDRAPALRRCTAALARDARALLIAFVATSVFLLGETTVFDLAQVATYGFEIRTLDALGASPRTVLAAALPVVALIAATVALSPAMARGLGDEALRARGCPRGADLSGTPWPSATLLLAALPMAVVAVLLVRAILAVPRAGDFLSLHGESLVTACVCAAAAAAVAGLLAAALRVALEGDAVIRRAAVVLGLLLLATGVAPATLTALAAEAAYNRPGLAAVYDSAAAVVVVLAARAAPISVLVAIGLAARQPKSAARLRALDSGSLRGAWRGARGEVRLASAAACGAAFVWSIAELIASGRVAPPGLRWMATDVLNAIHYQRPDTVVLFAGAMLACGVAALLLLLRVLRVVGLARIGAIVLVASAALALPSCGPGAGDGAAAEGADREMAALRAATPLVGQALAVESEFAGVGRGRGQFNAPRVVAHDPGTGWIYVIDKDARVQRFAPDGTVLAEWTMPKSDRGKPVGATVSPTGDLVVADTHEHRVVCFSPTGETLWTLGGYGKNDGEFIYPTDIAFAPDGRIFIAEYGGNDRIQVFDATRRFLYKFGSCGTAPGTFLRPQALALDAERDELFVVDSGNHRVQVFATDGEFRRALGSVGLERGRFSYPFGVVLEIGGMPAAPLGVAAEGIDAGTAPRTLVVVEHSNHRVQRIDAVTGESLAVAGGLGREPGRLKYAWAIAEAGRSAGGTPRFAVCDQGNSRIVFFTLPSER